MSLLRCETSKNDDHVEMLWCEACRKHNAVITGLKDFSRAWIAGSCNQKKQQHNHATSEQHKVAMVHVATATAKAAGNQLFADHKQSPCDG